MQEILHPSAAARVVVHWRMLARIELFVQDEPDHYKIVTFSNFHGSAHWQKIDNRCNGRADLKGSPHSNEAAGAGNRPSSFARAPGPARAGNRAAAWTSR